MKSEVINVKLFEQFEAEGHEVSYIKRNKRIIGARKIDPVKKLFEKGYISFEESAAADKYSFDFELSKQDNYAQAVLNGLPASTNEFSFEDKRSQASRQVNDVKMLVSHLCSYRQRKLKKKLSELNGAENLTTYHKILDHVFEKRLSIRRLETKIGVNYVDIEKKSKEIIKIIHNYYEN